MANPEVTELLRRVRQRIEDPARWCQGRYAVDANGESTGRFNPDAVRWCLAGALDVEGVGTPGLFSRGWAALAPHTDGALGAFNDTHSHAVVLAVLDAAIAAAEAERE